MMTYQDLLQAGRFEGLRMEVCLAAIRDHENSPQYKEADVAEQYYARLNPTMNKYKKVIYNHFGQAIQDYFSPNYKLTHGFFRRFVIQQVQYVLSNGVTFTKAETKKKLGKDFDTQLQKAAKKAMVDGISFGFWNFDHLDVFSLVSTPNEPAFVPLWDEMTGQLRAGIRYWRGTKNILRFTLYEEDGFTEYLKGAEEKTVPVVLEDKRPYILAKRTSEVDGTEIVGGENYAGLPIVPIYANDLRRSELQGIRPAIDCYDFIKSGMANNVDEASAFYWIMKNSGGMEDGDLMKFVERMKTVKAATVNTSDGVDVEAHTMNVPVEANEKLLDRLRADLYEDFMLMDTQKAMSGNMTATAIRLAYQQQDDKCGDFEYCIREFIGRILELAGIEDEPSFKWNRIANQAEETQMVVSAAHLIDTETALNHLPWLTPEEVKQAIQNMDAEGMARIEEEATEE